MESVLTCFGNIIGTTSDQESDSGLFITDLEAVETINGLLKGDDLPDTELEEKLQNARRIAILRLQADLQTLIAQFAKPRSGYLGLLGSNKYTGLLNDVGKSGYRLICRPIKDAELVLVGVNTIFSQTGEIDVFIASNYSDDITEVRVNTQANKVRTNTLAEPIALPLYHEDVDKYVEYYIYHENTLPAYNTKIKCSTCSKFHFDSNKPGFKEFGYEQYLNIAGFNGDVENLTNIGSNAGKGMQLNIELRCRVDRVICSDSIDFITNPMAMSFATAIQYKAGSVVVWDLIRTPNLNRVLMGDIETFREAASYYEKKYNEMVRYIAANMQIHSDCYCHKQKASLGRP